MLVDLAATDEAVAEDSVPGEDEVHPTVLVVEDEELVRMSAVEFLRFSDYQVVEAATADEAKAMLSNGAEVDLVFTDIRMPGRMSGLDLAQWLNTNHPSLPVLLTTGYAGAPRADRPPLPVLPKPYSLDGLLRKVAELLPDRAFHG